MKFKISWPTGIVIALVAFIIFILGILFDEKVIKILSR